MDGWLIDMVLVSLLVCFGLWVRILIIWCCVGLVRVDSVLLSFVEGVFIFFMIL